MKKRALIAIIILFIFTTYANADTLRIPLYKLTPVSSIDLKCIQSEYRVSVPIADRMIVKGATLHLKYVNSSALLAERSQLAIKLNEKLIGQVKFNPALPEGVMNLEIPADLIENGYNEFTIHTVMHYADQCEQFCSPGLWTTIDFYNSSLDIDYDYKPVPLKLSDMPAFLFDPKIFPNGEIHMVTKNLTSEKVTLAGIVASGISRKFDYRKVLFSISSEIKPEADNVLIGSKDYVESFLSEKGINLTVEGPLLKIMPLSALNSSLKNHKALLIVSGKTTDEIKMSAETLAHMSLPYPGTDEMIIKEFKLPDITLYSGRHILTTDKEYTFKNLNFDTHTFSGFNPSAIDITFRLPTDFLIKPNQYAKMIINFTYGAGMRNDAVLNVMVNDKTVTVIHLKNPSGDNIKGYKIDMPTYLFKPGHNTIKFLAYLNPVAKECDVVRQDGFFLTLYNNSTLYFPSMPHFVEMPKMELFIIDGFPFTRWPDGYESMIYITKHNNELVASALNLIGLISQKNGYPLFGIKINMEKPDKWDGDMIVLGEVKSIPEDLLKAAPLKLTKQSVVPYPVVRGWENETTFAISEQLSSIGADEGIVMEFESPYKSERSVFMITGASSREIQALSLAMLEPEVQGKIKGDITFINLAASPYRVKALSAGKNYFTGKTGKFFQIEYFFHRYSFTDYVFITLVILIISLSLYFILKRIRKKRMFDAKEDDPKNN